jgi:hypothetical protein
VRKRKPQFHTKDLAANAAARHLKQEDLRGRKCSNRLAFPKVRHVNGEQSRPDY